jgi:hypothetical protein
VGEQVHEEADDVGYGDEGYHPTAEKPVGTSDAFVLGHCPNTIPSAGVRQTAEMRGWLRTFPRRRLRPLKPVVNVEKLFRYLA